MQSRRRRQLDRVVLLGRTFEEYRRYFLLDPNRLVGKRVPDVAGGVSSFCAEGNKLGIKITAFDPIYSLSSEEIRQRSEPDLDRFTSALDICRRIAGVFTRILITCARYAVALALSFSMTFKFIRSVTWKGSCRDCRLRTASLI